MKQSKNTQPRQEFYDMVQALHYQDHYLLPEEFVSYSDHEALKYINSQTKLNNQNAKWISFLQEYTFIIKHKSGVENNTTDSLSRVVYILSSMAIQFKEFVLLKQDYHSWKNFSIINADLVARNLGAYPDFMLHDGYLFKGTPLCLPNTTS